MSVLLCACLGFGIKPAISLEKTAFEYQIKSAYLYNFLKFVRWPETAINAAQENITICVIGHADIHDDLYKLGDRSAQGYTLKVSLRDFDTGLEGCQLAYIGQIADRNAREIIKWCRQNHVLSVGDQPGFIERGGIIGFVIIDERVRLVINRTAAQASGLQISAKLLELAQVVE